MKRRDRESVLTEYYYQISMQMLRVFGETAANKLLHRTVFYLLLQLPRIIRHRTFFTEPPECSDGFVRPSYRTTKNIKIDHIEAVFIEIILKCWS